MTFTAATESVDADVVVVGGGITGIVLSVLLAQQRLSVTLIDHKDTLVPESCDADPRALALTLATRQILSHIGAWSCLPGDRIGQFTCMQVWDENGSGEVQFDSHQINVARLGHIVEASVLQAALITAIKNQPDIQVLAPVTLTDIQTDADSVIVHLRDGRRLRSRLIVGADGRHSALRQLAGIGFNSEDYDQLAICSVVKTELPHKDTARQRFLTDGTLAFLPMAEATQSGIVWSTQTEQAERLLQLEQAEFMLELADGFQQRLGRVVECGPRMHYPLSYGSAESYVQPRIALVGDAAHVVHPLAGQGANLGILDAAALSQTLSETSARQRDIGSLSALRRYERWRKGENRLMMQVLTGFKQAFTQQTEPVKWLRNTGMQLTNRVPMIKRQIMQYASGLRGDLPDIARVTY